jgi:hypothetical protein
MIGKTKPLRTTMRKLLTFLIALGAVAFGVCSPASAWGCREFGQQGGTGCNSVIASAPPPSTTTTWNPSDTSPNVALTSGNLNAARTTGFTGSFEGVRAIASHSTGKFFFSVLVGVNNTNEVGVANASAGLVAENTGTDINAIAISADSGQVIAGGSGSGSPIGTFTTGDVVDWAIDLGAKLVWVR